MIKLSQCMIVKDEERNIEKALSWGKNIVCEQIVVDTGSSDRTVEIAEGMGAKVYHFEWVKDFAAAKNFAIEKATGEWIAFLDADEYIEKEEVPKVLPVLSMIMSNPDKRDTCLAVGCPWVQLNDKGLPTSIDSQIRFFQSKPGIRYKGRIHEQLSVASANIVDTGDFRIMHTGYSESAYKHTGKSKKYVEMLRMELQEKPADINLKAYLANALIADIDNGDGGEAERTEAARLFREVADSGAPVLRQLKHGAYMRVLQEYMDSVGVDRACEEIAERALREYPDDCSIMCFYAMTQSKKGDYSAAMEVLKKCETMLDAAGGKNTALTTGVTGLFAGQMILAAQGLGDLRTAASYAAILLIADKTNTSVLHPYIKTLMRLSYSLEEILGELSQIYDMSDKRDLLLLARAAMDCGAIDLARAVMERAGS